MDQRTIEIYDRMAEQWARSRFDGRGEDVAHLAWVERHRVPGPVLDIGCGPGWHLDRLGHPRVGLDASKSMLALSTQNAPATPTIHGSAADLAVATGSLGGAVANRVYVHLPAATVPLALADLHRALAPDAPAFVKVVGDESGYDFRSRGRFAGRLYSGFGEQRLIDLCRGAGFIVDRLESDYRRQAPSQLAVRLRRRFSLADTVGPEMRLLVCGLNPSPYSAESGIGFGRPGNRFWPAALAAGAVSRDRDPRHALTAHGIGMTDLCKRATRTAAELSTVEYRRGLERVHRLVSWLQPAAICFVGLAGWRAAVDRSAVAGLQPGQLAGRPVYLMPSTSGLNARSSADELAQHLAAALQLADDAECD